MKTVMVIGGGVTGISTIYELQKWKKANNENVRLILVEEKGELGGKIRTIEKDGFVMESGADSMVARKAETMNFIEELGITEDLVYNATGISYIYIDGELKPIPSDAVFGIPASIESLATSTLVSAEGKVAALQDFYKNDHSFTKNDSVGDFLEYCFGKELVEKQIAPVLSGVYSGKINELTIASTLPYLLDYKNKYGSIIRGLEQNKEKFISGKSKFLSFKNGLSSLVHSYEAKFEGVEVLKNTRAESIERNAEGYRVSLNNGEVITADVVVLSVPHDVAAKLIDDPVLKKEFSGLKNSSLISVYVGFDVHDHVLPADGTGFIAASNDELSCNACTWTSRKWKHTSKTGNLLVRLFYKSSHPSYENLKNLGESELLKVACEDVRKSLGIEAKPLISEVTNWKEQMPNYLISHPQTVESLEEKLATEYPGVLLAGCSYYGVGISACIENGIETAKKISVTIK